MKSFIALLLFVLSTAGAVHAQGAGRFCQPTSSQRTTVKEIAADPKAWMGKCVTVPGIYSSEQVYADIGAIYGDNKDVIGGFADGKGTIDGFWSGTYTGRVADCAVAEQELAAGLLRSPGISANGRTMGCVKPEGPFLLFMSQRDLAPAKLTRRLAPAAGDLNAAAADAAMFSESGVIGRFLAALRASDKTQLTVMTGNAFAVEQLFADNTAVKDLREARDRPLQVMAPKSAGTGVSTLACWCRTANCAKRWPVALRDADNQSSRPYACLRVREDGHVDAGMNYDGLPEP